MPAVLSKTPSAKAGDYVLEEQVGFLLRQVSQRHTALFAAGLDAEVTPTQWAALAKLHELGPLSQNLLGRLTVMDAATIKGVIDRLCRRGLTAATPDKADRRRHVVTLTQAGQHLVERLIPRALRISDETLGPLNPKERAMLIGLLMRLR